MNRWNKRACLFLLISLAGCCSLQIILWHTVLQPMASRKTNGVHARPMAHSHVYQAEAHQARLDLMHITCKEYRSKHPPRDVIQQPSEFLVVDDKHKVIYCNVPKVGCTSWKKIFLNISGANINSEFKKVELNRLGRTNLNYVHKYNITHRRYVLDNYKKFLFVRDPFTRLLSAYQEKLSPWSRFGNDDYYTTVALRIIRQIHGHDTEQKVRARMSQYNLTFADFIHYLVDPRTEIYDKHWERFHELCLPCDIDYDFVGKFETFQYDAAYILNLTGIDIPFTQPKWFTNSSIRNTVEDFYQNVPTTDLKKLYHDKFIFDFKLFGYTPRTFTRKAFLESSGLD